MIGVDIIATSTKIVIGIPCHRRGKYANRRARFGGRHHPGEGEELTGFSLGMKIVKPGAFRRGSHLAEVAVAVTDFVPLYACLYIIAIGCDLHRGAGAMLVKPTQRANEFLLQPIAPKAQLI